MLRFNWFTLRLVNGSLLTHLDREPLYVTISFNPGTPFGVVVVAAVCTVYSNIFFCNLWINICNSESDLEGVVQPQVLTD